MRHARVVVVLSTPLTSLGGELFLSERAHAQTLELLAERFDDVLVVARVRTQAVLAASEHIALGDTGARLGMELPDYGGGTGRLRRILSFIASPARRRALHRLIDPARALYVESPSLEAVLAWSLIRRRGVPYIIEMRGDTILNPWYMRSRMGAAGPLASRMIGRFYRAFRRRAAGAVFVGEELRSRYELPHAPTVAVSSVRLPPGNPRAPRSIRKPAQRFLFVGHLERVKAIDVLLRAVAAAGPRLPDGWRLDLLGDGPQRGALEALATDLGIAGSVHFHRRVPWGPELFAFYEAAELLLMASLTEGNSRTLIEGMSFGVPALSTAVGEAPRLLPPAALVPPGDVTALADALVRIAGSPELLESLSRGNVAMTQQYAPAELRRRRAAFFDEVLGLHPAAPPIALIS